MAAKDTEPKKPEDRAEGGGSMLDMSQAAVKKMIATAKSRGYITYDELNEVLPPDQVTSEQIEDVMAMLSEMGINVIDNDEAEEEDGSQRGRRRRRRRSGSRELADDDPSAARRSTAPTTRCACTCARWARSSCSSREGEIAIAKRIEAGRNTMIAGLCESPLTFQAITVWRDELLDEAIMLRDVIDLETTFSGQMEADEVESVLSGLKAGEPVVRAPGPGAPPKPKPEPAPRPARAAASADGDEDGTRTRTGARARRRRRPRRRPSPTRTRTRTRATCRSPPWRRR